MNTFFVMLATLLVSSLFPPRAFAEKFDTILNLQVGSRHFTVAREVLCRKESMLCRMFSDLEFPNTEKGRLPNGAYYIDADEEAFAHVIEFMRQDTVTIKKGKTLPQLERVYALADQLSFWELKQYTAKEIWKMTPKNALENFSYDVWKNIPEIPIHFIERTGRDKQYPYFLMTHNKILLGDREAGVNKNIVKKGHQRNGNLVVFWNGKSDMPFNALNGIQIGISPRDSNKGFDAAHLLTTVKGFYMCSLAESTSKFAIFHILTGNRPFSETYSNLEDCAKDICSIYGWCEDTEEF